MNERYTTDDGLVWYTGTSDAPRPTAHVGAAGDASPTDLLETLETRLATSGSRQFNLADHLLHESDALGYVTVGLPATTTREATRLLREIEACDSVDYAEFQRAYANPEAAIADKEGWVDTIQSGLAALRRRVTELVRDLLGATGDDGDETPNDPLVTDQYGPQQIRAYEAQKALVDPGNEVTVAVLDSGIDPDHEDLEAQIPANAGEDFSDGLGGDTDPTYPDVRGGDHGVHVGGTIAATVGNDIGIAGVAGLPNVSLITGKIFGGNPRALGQTVAEAIRWATDEGADVVNMSIGGTGTFGLPSETVERAIEYADANGTVCVAAAGNAGNDKVDFPARHPMVVGVGAVDENETVADFSNRGDGVDIAAPGVRVTSTLPGDDYGDKSGTSMSAPHVAAVVALGYLANGDASTEDRRRKLRATAKPVDGAGPDEVGAGIPDTVAYINALRE